MKPSEDLTKITSISQMEHGPVSECSIMSRINDSISRCSDHYNNIETSKEMVWTQLGCKVNIENRFTTTMATSYRLD